jgi:hypothetical protein
MNYFFMPEETPLLDRLVDGELNDAERRALLERLERTPDGWRRCALAFLEQQAWRSEARAYASGAPEIAIRPTAANVTHRGWSVGTWSGYALAACLMLALGAWLIVRDKDAHEVARIKVPEGGLVTVTPEAIPPAVPKSRPTTPDGAANVRLVVEGGPYRDDEVVEVPLIDAGRLDEALFGQWSQAVPADALQMMEQLGHQVVRERRLVPIQLRDGRRVVVPMDQLEIVPVRNVQQFQ